MADNARRARDLADHLHELADELAEMATDDEGADELIDRAIDGLTAAEDALDEYAERLSATTAEGE